MSSASSYRVFLVLMPFCDVHPDLYLLLEPLEDFQPYLPAVEGFYASANDTALLGLVFRMSAVQRIGAEALIEVIAECGLPVLAPDEYESEQREAFYGRHLPAYEYHVRTDQPEFGGPADSAIVDRTVAALWRFAQGPGRLPTASSVEPPGAFRQREPDETGERSRSQWEFVL